jgi:holo-[acyl-carrier protein] synthase
MIVGLGSDLCNIERIENSLERWGDKFLKRVFTDVEQAKAASRPHTTAGTLAKRFAAKEAFTKALGTGIRAPANWHGVWVRNLASGKPVLEFSDALQRYLATKGVTSAHVSLSDERGVAFATVILECEK